MPRGIRKQLSLAEEIIDLDRLLLVSVRKNLSLAERANREDGNGDNKEVLKRFLSKHPLRKEKEPEQTILQEPKPVSERERKIERCVRHLRTVSDPNLLTLVEVIKSMSRQETAAQNEGGKKVSKKGGKKNGASEPPQGEAPSSEPAPDGATV